MTGLTTLSSGTERLSVHSWLLTKASVTEKERDHQKCVHALQFKLLQRSVLDARLTDQYTKWMKSTQPIDIISIHTFPKLTYYTPAQNMSVLIWGLFSRANIQYVLIRAHCAVTAPRSAARHASHYSRTIVAAGALWDQTLIWETSK